MVFPSQKALPSCCEHGIHDDGAREDRGLATPHRALLPDGPHWDQFPPLSPRGSCLTRRLLPSYEPKAAEKAIIASLIRAPLGLRGPYSPNPSSQILPFYIVFYLLFYP